jgi:RNA polymerase sigma factor (sigma-70 family)
LRAAGGLFAWQFETVNNSELGMTQARSEKKITIAIVEDRADVREKLSRLIGAFPEFRCVCTCMSAEEALQIIPAHRPNIVLMDIFLTRMSGIECTSRLKDLLPETRVIILTAMNARELIFRALEAGADGYLLKRTMPSDLHNALKEVSSGGSPLSSEIARTVVESFHRKSKAKKDIAGLSAREEQILVFLTKGCTNKEIADELKLSRETVHSHLQRVYDKLQVHTRTEAAVRYLAFHGKN